MSRRSNKRERAYTVVWRAGARTSDGCDGGLRMGGASAGGVGWSKWISDCRGLRTSAGGGQTTDLGASGNRNARELSTERGRGWVRHGE